METKKTVKTFAVASFLNDLGSDMIAPVWPLFLVSVLGANMAIIGLIDGLGDAIVSISQAISGYASDRLRKRKVFIWIGYLCAGISRIGYAFTTVWQYVIPFKILDRAGKMRGAPRDAIIADISTAENRGSNFGILRAMDNLWAVFGIIISIMLFSSLGFRTLFLIAAIPSLIGAAPIFFFIKEKAPSRKIFPGMSLKDIGPNLRLVFFLNAIFALGSFNYSFLMIFAQKFGVEIALIPVLYLIFNVVAAAFSIPFGRLTDRLGRKPVLMIAFVCWALTCFSLIYSQSHWVIIMAFVVYGFHKAAVDTSQTTLVSELAPADYRASTLGGFQMVMGICALPASMLAGIMWDKISPLAPFYFSLALTILSMLLLVFVKEGVKMVK